MTFHSDYSICQKVPAPDGGVRLPAFEDVARVAPPRESHAEDDVRRRELVENSSGDFKLEKEVGKLALECTELPRRSRNPC